MRWDMTFDMLHVWYKNSQPFSTKWCQLIHGVFLAFNWEIGFDRHSSFFSPPSSFKLMWYALASRFVGVLFPSTLIFFSHILNDLIFNQASKLRKLFDIYFHLLTDTAAFFIFYDILFILHGMSSCQKWNIDFNSIKSGWYLRRLRRIIRLHTFVYSFSIEKSHNNQPT